MVAAIVFIAAGIALNAPSRYAVASLVWCSENSAPQRTLGAWNGASWRRRRRRFEHASACGGAADRRRAPTERALGVREQRARRRALPERVVEAHGARATWRATGSQAMAWLCVCGNSASALRQTVLATRRSIRTPLRMASPRQRGEGNLDATRLFLGGYAAPELDATASASASAAAYGLPPPSRRRRRPPPPTQWGGQPRSP